MPSQTVNVNGLPAPAALSDTTANPTTVQVGAVQELWNPSTSSGDTSASAMVRMRSNYGFTLLASAARTTAQTTAVQYNYNFRGLILALNITAASGTGGLAVRLEPMDQVGGATGAAAYMNAAVTAIVATGLYHFLFYPGSSTSGLKQVNSINVPYEWRAIVSVGDASSYTYSLTGAYLL